MNHLLRRAPSVCTLLVCVSTLIIICIGNCLPEDKPARAVLRTLPPTVLAADEAEERSLSDDDIELLARVISAEARGEEYEGQVAVGAVIINRTKSPDFPDTVSGVCFQPGAFSGVADGQISIAPDESCIRAALAAAAGDDPTGGALFFYNPKTAGDGWIRSRPVVAIIGNHSFCV